MMSSGSSRRASNLAERGLADPPQATGGKDNMKNKYKIDVNSYVSGAMPFALYVKRPFRWYWEHIESFKTLEEARAKFDATLLSVPIYLERAWR